MLKPRYFILSVLIFLICLSFVRDKSKILWTEDIELQFSDFQDTPPKKLNSVLARSSFFISYSYKTENGGVPKFSIQTYFERSKSWIFEEDSMVLAHEKVHFDLAELYTRKIRKKILQLNQNGVKNLKDYHKAIDRIRDENNKADILFDSQSYGYVLNGKRIENHTRERLIHWQDSIQIELQRLDKFK